MIALRLVAGVAHVSSVRLDDDAHRRGEDLVARLKAGFAPGWYDGHRRDEVAPALLRLVHEDDEVLRETVPPLRQLFPAPPPSTSNGYYGSADSFGATLRVALSPEVYADLAEAAANVGLPVDAWVADELARLSAWPHRPLLDRDGRFTDPDLWLDDEPDWGSSSVVRLDRRRR